MVATLYLIPPFWRIHPNINADHVGTGSSERGRIVRGRMQANTRRQDVRFRQLPHFFIFTISL